MNIWPCTGLTWVYDSSWYHDDSNALVVVLVIIFFFLYIYGCLESFDYTTLCNTFSTFMNEWLNALYKPHAVWGRRQAGLHRGWRHLMAELPEANMWTLLGTHVHRHTVHDNTQSLYVMVCVICVCLICVFHVCHVCVCGEHSLEHFWGLGG